MAFYQTTMAIKCLKLLRSGRIKTIRYVSGWVEETQRTEQTVAVRNGCDGILITADLWRRCKFMKCDEMKKACWNIAIQNTADDGILENLATISKSSDIFGERSLAFQVDLP